MREGINEASGTAADGAAEPQTGSFFERTPDG